MAVKISEIEKTRYKLDEASITGTVVDDSSANENDGTLVGWSPETLWQELNRDKIDLSTNITTDSSESGLDGTMSGFTRNDGTVSGGVTISEGAMVFDGIRTASGGKVLLGNPSALQIGDNPQSIYAWIRTNNQPDSNTAYIYSSFNGFNGELTLGIGNNGNQLKIFIGNTRYIINLNTSLLDNLPHLVGIEYDGIDIRGYVDNVLVGTVTSPIGTWDTTTNKQISGRENSDSFPFQGELNVLVYKKDLSSDERTQIYNAGKDAYSPISDGLVGQWSGKQGDFAGTEANPTTIYDTNMLVSDGSGGTALKFSDNLDRVSITGLSSIFTQTGTYTVFCQVKRTASEQNANIWNFGGSGSNRHNLNWDRGRLGFQRYNGSSYTGKTLNTAILNEEVSICCINNGGTLTLFVNGVEATTSNNVYVVNDNSNNFYIGYPGRSVNSSKAIKGYVKNTRIFPRVLSTEEISQITANPTVPLPLYRSGKQFDKALYFNGIDRYVDVSNIQDLHLGKFTVSMWVNSQLLRNGQRLIYERNSFMLWLDGNNELRFQYNIAGNRNNAVTAGQLPQNDFIHIIAEFDGSSGKIYLNNVDVTAPTSSYADLGAGTDNLLTIGRRTDNLPITFFEGLIQDVRIYDQVLSIEERSALYNQGLGRVKDIYGKLQSKVVAKIRSAITRVLWSELNYTGTKPTLEVSNDNGASWQEVQVGVRHNFTSSSVDDALKYRIRAEEGPCVVQAPIKIQVN